MPRFVFYRKMRLLFQKTVFLDKKRKSTALPISRPLSNFDLMFAAPFANCEWKIWLVQVPEKLLASEHQHTERPAERKRKSLGCKGPSRRDRWRRSYVSRRAIWWIKCARHIWVVFAWRCLPGVTGAEGSKRQELQYQRGYSARA
jgi:hypothetical protein